MRSCSRGRIGRILLQLNGEPAASAQAQHSRYRTAALDAVLRNTQWISAKSSRHFLSVGYSTADAENGKNTEMILKTKIKTIATASITVSSPRDERSSDTHKMDK